MPGGDFSVTVCPWVSAPYQPIAEPLTSAAGASAPRRAIARTSSPVPSTRDSRICCFAVRVSRPPMLRPARLTTTSTPCSAAGSSVPASGSQEISSGVRAARRTRRSTVCPPVLSRAASWVPIVPEAPVIATRSGSVR